MKVRGVEVSDYAVAESMPLVKPYIVKSDFTKLPFENREFDFVIAIGVVYTLNLRDAISCLKGNTAGWKGNKLYNPWRLRNEQGARLFKYWTLLGATILHVDEWIEVLKESGYTGDYQFVTEIS